MKNTIILTLLGSTVLAVSAFADNGCPKGQSPYEHTVQSCQQAGYVVGPVMLNHNGTANVCTTDKTTICVHFDKAGQAFNEKGQRVPGADNKH